jgi:RNA polymerase-binding transcription factor DksA
VPDAASYLHLLNERISQAQDQQAALVTAIEEMRLARSLTFADDEHDPEGSTVSLDQARDAALLDRIEQTLTELDAARRRLASDRYGGCEQCGSEIPTERLLARPEARLCMLCSQNVARRNRR